MRTHRVLLFASNNDLTCRELAARAHVEMPVSSCQSLKRRRGQEIIAAAGGVLLESWKLNARMLSVSLMSR